jgi:hypothetical protein
VLGITAEVKVLGCGVENATQPLLPITKFVYVVPKKQKLNPIGNKAL